jgi:ATP-dependent Clp protease ATP-binding subunit ClpC
MAGGIVTRRRLHGLVLALYPSWWRQRYRDEIDAILVETESGVGALPDLIRGAVDAWTRQRPPEPAFARFGQAARDVLVHAQKEAHALGHGYVGTEHVLLGLLADPDLIPARALRSLGVSSEIVRTRVLEIVGRGDEAVPPAQCSGGSSRGELPKWGMRLTSRTKHGFACARAAADRSGHPDIDDADLLLGLLEEPEGVGAMILAELAEFDRIRERLAGLRSP